MNGKTEGVLSRLEAARCVGGQYVARCPAHDDGKPSLSVCEGERAVLLHCHAGCSVNEIRKRLGLSWRDLFFDGRSGRRRKLRPRETELEALLLSERLQDEPKALAWLERERAWTAAALAELRVGYVEREKRLTLPVYDKQGCLHDVLLYSPRQGVTPKMLAGFGRSRTLWPAPEQVEVPVGSPLFLVEGEGTAISLWSVGLRAVALPGAVAKASGSLTRPSGFEGSGWHRSWASRFSRFPKVVLIPDCDQTGRRLMWVASYDLRKAGVYHYEMDIDPSRSDGWDVGDLLKRAVSPSLRDGARRYLLGLASEYRRAVRSLRR